MAALPKRYKTLEAVTPLPTNETDVEGKQSMSNILPSFVHFVRGLKGGKSRKVDPHSHRHDGWDLAVMDGSPIYSPADGTVISNSAVKGYGWLLKVRHKGADGKDIVTVYAHLNPKFVQVKKYDTVKKGQLLAFSSDFGSPGSYHLHFEVFEDGVLISPSRYFFVPYKKASGSRKPETDDFPSSRLDDGEGDQENLGIPEDEALDQDAIDDSVERFDDSNIFIDLFNELPPK